MSEINADALKRNFFKILVTVIILLAFIYVLTPFYIPIVLGGILAMAFSPFLRFFCRKGWNRKVSLLVLTLVLFFICIAPVGLIIVKGTKIVSNFLSEQSIVETKHHIEEKIYMLIDRISAQVDIDPSDLREKFAGFVGSIGTFAFNLFSSFLAQIPNVFMLSLITILSFYFFLLDEDKIRRWFDRYFYFSKNNGDRFIFLLKTACKDVFISNVLTGIIQASIIAFGAFFTKTGDFFIIFIITFFLSFIPVVGASPTGFVLAIAAFISDRIGAGIAMAIVATFSGIIDNIIRPYLNSFGVVKVPAFVTFLAIIGGVITLGLAGLFVGPLLASLAYGALPIVLDEWFPLDENKER